MSEILEIKGDAPKSIYTSCPGWETHGEQGVLIMAASTLKSEQVAVWGDIHTGKEYVTKRPIIVEIGSENGMSASLFAKYAPDAYIVCIEIDENANFMHNLKAIGLDKNVIPLYGNSAKMDWKKESTAYLRAKPEIDLLFIDGDHSFDGALADLRNFAPYVAIGGWLILHDCACATNRLPHSQHYTVSVALQNYMVESGHEQGYKHLFSVDTMMCYRRF